MVEHVSTEPVRGRSAMPPEAITPAATVRGPSRFRRFAALAVAAMTFAASPAWAQVKFGALFPFSGDMALLGEESFRGLELAVKETNASGGVQGQQIVLVRGDAVDTNQAIGEARRLISVDGVKAIFGTYASSRSLPASQVAELAGIPYFELGAASAQVTERGFNYLFRTSPTGVNMGEVAVNFLEKGIIPALGANPKDLKLVILHEDSSYGTTAAKSIEQYAKQAGLNVIDSQPYSTGTLDMSPVILRLKEQGADAVIHISSSNSDPILFLRQAHEMNFKPKAIIGCGSAYSSTATEQAVGPEVMNGVFGVDLPQLTASPTWAKGIDKFAAAYKAAYGTPPISGNSLNNYAGAMAILGAINGAKSFEPDAIVAAVGKIEIPEGGTAAGYGVKFDAKHQNESAQMTGLEWQHGKLQTVYPAAAATAKILLGE